MAATWNATLLGLAGQVMSTEQRAKFNEATRDSLDVPMNYGLNLWGPNINLFDKSLWGRGQETYGEDPFLTGRLAAAFIGGLQGDLDPATKYHKVAATAKHFAAYQASGVGLAAATPGAAAAPTAAIAESLWASQRDCTRPSRWRSGVAPPHPLSDESRWIGSRPGCRLTPS